MKEQAGLLEKELDKIQQADRECMERAVKRWNAIAKPIHSLGRLEDAVVKLAGIYGIHQDITIENPALVILCGDHGVVREGISQTGMEVTRIVAENFTKGNASVNAMARTAGVSVFPVDLGIASIMPDAVMELSEGKMYDCKLRFGSGDIAVEPAMSEAECRQALQIGIDLVQKLKQKGYRMIATGEMGIGNTTPSSALAAYLLAEDVEKVTGKGAGLPDAAYHHKIKIIKQAIQRYKDGEINETQENDALTAMAQLGGLEIVGMAGLFLGGALYKVPILIDGFISSVAALCAVRLCPNSKDYMIATHQSNEPAGQRLLEELGLQPFLTCEMCLGEGTGAVAAIPIIRMALAVYEEMSTFAENAIEEYTVYEKK